MLRLQITSKDKEQLLQVEKMYFNRGFGYKDITIFLGTLHGIHISVIRLKQILKKLRLRRRQPHTEERMQEVLTAINGEIEESGKGS